jgi:hypothetical protein
MVGGWGDPDDIDQIMDRVEDEVTIILAGPIADGTGMGEEELRLVLEAAELYAGPDVNRQREFLMQCLDRADRILLAWGRELRLLAELLMDRDELDAREVRRILKPERWQPAGFAVSPEGLEAAQALLRKYPHRARARPVRATGPGVTSAGRPAATGPPAWAGAAWP